MKESSLREQTCFFTGHRDIPREKYPAVHQKLAAAVERLITEEAVRYFCCGGGVGFDTIAALTVIKLKRAYPHIRLALILPCKEFNWQEDRDLLKQIMERADSVAYISETYKSGSMNKRNRSMAENSGWCVCYLERPTGGTAYAVNYAKSIGTEIVNLAES